MTQLRISPPSTPALVRSLVSTPTNSLVVAGLPHAFFHPLVLEALRDHFAAYGEIYAWAPIRAFARVMLVYYAEEDAESAKMDSDRLTLNAPSTGSEFVLRVFRGDPTPIRGADSASCQSTPSHSRSNSLDDQQSPFHLRVPKPEKNFLISPPGSPPVGWEQTVEEPPNAVPLAEDLIIALKKLQFTRDFGRASADTPFVSVLVEPEESCGGVGVYVEDCDGDLVDDAIIVDDEKWDSGEGWFYGAAPHIARTQFMPIPTARPPMPAGM